MASAPCQPSSKRYDCYISCHGDERLADLGFSGRGMEGTVSDLAKWASDRLGGMGGRHPSVFYYHSGIGGRISEQLAQALLELRGAGVGLVLLSPGYFREMYRLAELRAFLELEYLRSDRYRSSETIEIRFVCLQKEYEYESVKEAFNGPSLKGFFDGLNLGDIQLHHVPHDAPRAVVVPVTVHSQAVKEDKLTDKNLEDLLRKTDDVNAKDALRSFSRKWIADGWNWSIRPGKNDFNFPLYVDEANKVLSLVQQAAASTGIAPTTTPLPPQSSASQSTCSHQRATFRPIFPDGQRLSNGLEANAATSLAQLKAAVLSTSFGDGSPGACDSGNQESSATLRRVALTSVAGEGGVGKTSTCQLLCADEGARKHFAGGAILWIDVGQGATEEKVKGQIRDALRKCGGKDEAKEICTDTSMEEAVGIANVFFSEHRILVVIDNVWETPTNSGLVSWAATLSKIASCHGSVVIMTTRSSSLSEGSGFDPIRLGRLHLATANSPDWHIAEQLYDALLQATPEEKSCDDYKRHRRKGLGLSCGLLLGIRTFAGLVRNRMRIGGNVQSLLEKIEGKVLGLAGRSVGMELKSRIGHHGLCAAMVENLAHLDEYKSDCVKLAPLSELKGGQGKDVRQFRASYDRHVGKPLSSRYAALEMMQESLPRLPFPVLCRLWHVASVAEAEEIALMFVNIGLGCIERSRGGQEELVLHDLQYEFCVNISKGKAGPVAGADGGIRCPVNGHAIFLSSCESLVSSGVTAGGPGSGWGAFCFRSFPALDQCDLRRHVAQNLFRHLSAAAPQENCGAMQTMLGSLIQFEWIRGRICAHGRNAILSDCEYALELLRRRRSGAGARSSDTSGGELPFVLSLRFCLLLTAEGVSAKSDGPLPGSLCQLAQSCAGSEGSFADEGCIANRLATSVERHVRGPWLKPISGCSNASWSGQGTNIAVRVRNSWDVECLAGLGDAKHVISGCGDGVVRVHDCVYLGTELELVGHSKRVRCVAAATKEEGEKTFRVFSGGDDNVLRFWDVQVVPKGIVREVESGIVGSYKRTVLSLAVSSNAARVAGCDSINVFFWKKAGGEEGSFYEMLARFASPWMGTSLAISRSGELVVAGGSEGNIWLWNEDGQGRGVWEEDPGPDKAKNSLVAASLSWDEKSLLCVFSDATVEIRDLQSRRIRSIALSQSAEVRQAIFIDNEYTEAGGSKSSWRFIAVGKSQGRKVAVEYCMAETLEVLSRYRVPQAWSSLSSCFAPHAGSRRLVVGYEDDMCMVEANGLAGSVGDEVEEGGRPSSRNPVTCVTVLPVSGRVVAGHANGDLTLWMVEDGKLERRIGPEWSRKVRQRTVENGILEYLVKAAAVMWRGEVSERTAKNRMKIRAVTCVDVSDDECVAVSGHLDGFALVWDVVTWKCLFSLEGEGIRIFGATISADKSRIAIVDWDGKLHLWNLEDGAPLAAVKSGISNYATTAPRGAFSRDGKFFLWATGDFGECKAALIDLAAESVIYAFDEEDSNWCAVLKEVNQRAVGAEAEEEVQWRFGAVNDNKLVDLAAKPRCPQESWEVTTGWRRSQEVSCALRSAGEPASPRVDMFFDTEVESIAAGWMQPGEGGKRRAAVACALRWRNVPAIIQFFP